MAMVEIPETPFAPFLKLKDVFAKVGDKFYGVFISQSEGNYGTDYVFNTATGNVCLTIKGSLKKQLDTACLAPGNLVAIQLKGFVDTGKDNPMKSFKVGVDTDYKGALPKNGPNCAVQKREPAPAATDDEMPF